MNRWAISGLALMMALSAFGCERKGSQQAPYDPKVDAQPSPGLRTPSDSGIMGDQTQISKNAEAANKPAPTATPPSASSSAPASGPESATPPASKPAPATASAPATAPAPAPGTIAPPTLN